MSFYDAPTPPNTPRSVLQHITATVLDYAENEHTLSSLSRVILAHAKELTQSRYAILGGVVYSGDGNVVSCPCYSDVTDTDTPFQHDIFLMDSAFRRCIDSNSIVLLPPGHGVKLPPGHLPIESAALVPLRFRGRPSGLIGLANRSDSKDYQREELEQLHAFFVVVANILASFQLNEDILREKDEKVKLAQSVAEAKDSFLAKISHEIRTPLNGIVGMTRVLLNMSLSQNVRQKVNIINECSYQLISQVDDLLDYSKMTCGKLALNPAPVCLRSCVEKAFDVIAAKASEKELTINSLVDTAVPAYVEVDSKRLRQILVNLLNNAVKFTHSGYIVVRVRELLPQPAADQHRLQFEVEDSGVGIPPADHTSIFDSFSQGGNSSSADTDGTGLGLAICSKLVQLMNGSISVASQVGRGSCFTFTITAGAASVPKEDLASFETSLQGLRALVVDDKVLNQVVLCSMLQRWSISSVLCESGQSALRYLQSGLSFDIAFIDIQMPQMNGYELAQRIRSISAAYFPMIAVSSVDGWVSSDDSSLFTLTLQKPLKENTVYDALLRVLHPVQQCRRLSVAEGNTREPHSLRVLVAEDSDSNQKVIESQLLQLGYGGHGQLTMVENGLQAVKAAKKHKYDVIFMDLKMPVMNGFDAARRIRATSPSSPPFIVALSAMVLDRDKEQCKQCGMDFFVGKPVDLDELDRVLRTIVCRIETASS